MADSKFSRDTANKHRAQSQALSSAASRFSQWLNVVPLPASVPKIRDDISVYLYFDGKLLSEEVGELVGRHRHTVINVIRAHGLKPRTAQESLKMRLARGLPEVSESEFRRLHSLELSLAEMGRTFQRSAQWALNECRRLGLPTRTPAEGRWARLERDNPITDPDELLDPAYEARPGIAKHVHCKLCGIPVTDLTKHLRTRHPEIPTRKAYRKIRPGARVTPFAQEARQQGVDKEGLTARFAEKYVTRAQLRECRSNPQWEEEREKERARFVRAEIPTPWAFCVCRICGFK